MRKPRLSAGEKGQAMIELATIVPLAVVFTFACFQFAILFITYLGMMNSARDDARWLAINPNTLDSTAIAAFNDPNRLPPGIDPAKLTIAINPPCTLLTSGKCAGRSAGTAMTLTYSYNAASRIFLPTTAGCCGFTAAIPTALPTYTIQIMAEPT